MIKILASILRAIKKNTDSFKIVFPVHPRTRRIIHQFKINFSNIIMNDPLGYLEFTYLIKIAKGIIADSGGITEEATVFNILCLTIRNSTERPEAVTVGTNELIGNDLNKLSEYLSKIIDNKWKKGEVPKLWDGHTSERIIDYLVSIYSNNYNELK